MPLVNHPATAGGKSTATARSLQAPPIWRRLACSCYEGVLMFGVVWIAAYLFGTLSQTRHALDNRHALQAFLFLIFGMYFTWFWSRGQTLAMKTWHIRVVSLSGLPLTQGRACVRYLAAWLWFIPPLLLAAYLQLRVSGMALCFALWMMAWVAMARFHPQRQFLHDALAGTRLIASASERS